MLAVLVLATLADLALAALLVAVSGFVLQGVTNTGPEMPEAAFYVGYVALCVVAPVAAWMLRLRRARPALVLGMACAPLAIAALALVAEPLLT
jgi:uncharacterized membrane protein